MGSKKTMLLLAVALACIAVAGFVTRHFRGSWGDPAPTAVAGPALNTSFSVDDDSESEMLVYGYISGAVRHAGVFPLPKGARLFQLVEAAGGFLPDADTSRVNLAAPVRDGAHLHVPLVGEKASTGSAASVITPIKGSSLIYVNLAAEHELALLPGVGPILAARIVEARAQGPFLSPEDMLRVPGLGRKKLENMLPLLRFDR